jgi:hypothetical protein
VRRGNCLANQLMDKSRKRKIPWPLIACALILGVLAISSKTGWLVRHEVVTTLGVNAPMLSLLRELGVQSDLAQNALGKRQIDLQPAAKRSPRDFQIQLAYVLITSSRDSTSSAQPILDRLKALEQSFPDSPSLCAQQLRNMTLNKVMVARSEEDYSSSSPSSRSALRIPRHKNDVQQLLVFDRIAARGERIEPQNAFFPAMRAVGLFGAHKDKEAIQAVKRAGGRPEWNDYVIDEQEGRLRLMSEAAGRVGAVQEVVQIVAILFPHYAQLRAVTRMAIYEAAGMEKAGNNGDGIAIRHAMMHLGGLMRAKSATLIGSLVGIAIAQISTYRPGGAPAAIQGALMSPDEKADRRLKEYCAFITAAGYRQEADYATAEISAAKEARNIATRATDLSPISGVPMYALYYRWVVDCLLMTNVLWFLLLGTLSLILTRLRAAAGKMTPFLVIGMLCLLGAMVWNARGTEALVTYFQVERSLTGTGEDSGPSLALIRAGTVAAALALPILLSVSSLIYCVVTKSAFAEAIAKGACAIALLLAAVYAVSVLTTLRQEDYISREMRRAIKGEGQYAASVQNKKWPGPPG